MPNVIGRLVNFTLNDKREKYQKDLTDLVVKVAHGTGSGLNGFTFANKLYQSDKYAKKITKSERFPALPIKYHEEFLHIHNMERELEDDSTVLKQLFTVLMTGCKTEQDVRNALPEFFIVELNNFELNSELRFLKNYSRTKPEGWNIDGNSKMVALTQNKLMPILSMKVMSKFLE